MRKLKNSMVILSNGCIVINVAPKGAELKRLFSLENKIDYLWEAHPDYWAKTSPILFPIVGGLKNNTYRYQGKDYKLTRHGFARDQIFTVTNEEAHTITLSLSSTEETLLAYPFEYRFDVTYTLLSNTLIIGFTVTNTGKEVMYFSIGAHPAFKVPLLKEFSFEDYYLQFNCKETAARFPLSADGLLEMVGIDFFQAQDTLSLKKDLFYNDALVYKDLQSDTITIKSNKSPHGIEVSFKGFPYMGLWSAKNADFVCIEPWCGIADSQNTTGDIEIKEGIISLLPGAIFTKYYSITVF